MKQLLLAVVLSVWLVGVANAGVYGILGAMIVKGPEIGVDPITVNFDGRELFLSEADCNASLQKVLRGQVTTAKSALDGMFSQTAAWSGVPNVVKISTARCVPTTQLN
jgi:hypothetical protein